MNCKKKSGMQKGVGILWRREKVAVKTLYNTFGNIWM